MRLNELRIPVPGCCAGTAGKNAKKMHGYIQRRYEQDKAGEKLAIQASKKACMRAAGDGTFAAGRAHLRGVTRRLIFRHYARIGIAPGKAGVVYSSCFRRRCYAGRLGRSWSPSALHISTAPPGWAA